MWASKSQVLDNETLGRAASRFGRRIVAGAETERLLDIGHEDITLLMYAIKRDEDLRHLEMLTPSTCRVVLYDSAGCERTNYSGMSDCQTRACGHLIVQSR